MAYPEDSDAPRYMHLQGKTQYEMAQSIDAAFAAAEQSIHQQAEQTALQWWYQQLESQVQEDFNLPDSALPKGNANTQVAFFKLSSALIKDAMRLGGTSEPSAMLGVKRLLQRSLIDAIDMMQAQGIWRFDLQRTLQTLQGRLLHECQHAKLSPIYRAKPTSLTTNYNNRGHMATILIVDDSATMMEGHKRILEKQGHTVHSAEDGEEGFAKAKELLPDLILMDVVMPKMNGFQATRKITKNDSTKHIPVIIVTSKDQETDIMWGKRQGASDYLIKPADEKQLQETSGLLARYKAKKEAAMRKGAATADHTWNLLFVSANAATDALAQELGVQKRDLVQLAARLKTEISGIINSGEGGRAGVQFRNAKIMLSGHIGNEDVNFKKRHLWAPVDTFSTARGASEPAAEPAAAAEAAAAEDEEDAEETASLFVKNLSFKTDEKALEKAFQRLPGYGGKARKGTWVSLPLVSISHANQKSII
eukprot:gene137-101_t